MLSNTSFLSARGGYFLDNYNDTGIPNTTNYTYQTSSVGVAGIPASLQGPIGTQNTPRALIVEQDKTTRGFFNLDYNNAFHAAGYHTLKAGYGLQNTVNDATRPTRAASSIFWAVRSRSRAPPVAAPTATTRSTTAACSNQAGSDIHSLYVQDQWTLGDRLTLNLGLRAENETVPAFRPEANGATRSVRLGDKLAPRLGAAYDVFGDGQMKVFGSWGRYYDWTKYELPRGSFGGERGASSTAGSTRWTSAA